MDLGLGLKDVRRVALITGSTRGLGKAIAVALAKEKVEVIINGRSEESVLKTTKEISERYKVQTWACPIDATDSKAINDFFRFGPIAAKSSLDILVNNVGNIEKFGGFEDLNELDWQRSFDLTFMGAVRFTYASLPYLKRSDQARIINISSLSGRQPSVSGLNPHYGFAKAGLINLTKNLANDLGRYGITVNAICPSTLAGGGWDNNVRDRAKRDGIIEEEAEKIMRQEEGKKSPLGRVGELKDVAALAVYLASANANFLTGHCYNVDGGITRGI